MGSLVQLPWKEENHLHLPARQWAWQGEFCLPSAFGGTPGLQPIGHREREGGEREEEEDTAYLIPSRSISPNLNQLLVEFECLLINRAAVKLGRGNLDVGF